MSDKPGRCPKCTSTDTHLEHTENTVQCRCLSCDAKGSVIQFGGEALSERMATEGALLLWGVGLVEPVPTVEDAERWERAMMEAPQ